MSDTPRTDAAINDHHDFDFVTVEFARGLERELRAALDGISEAVQERERLERLVYVPGMWKCAKCSFGLTSIKLHVNVGAASANNDPQQCANGCGPMWRVTERDAGNELCDQVDKMHGYLRDVCEALGMAAFPMPQAREEMLRRARGAAYAGNCEAAINTAALVIQSVLLRLPATGYEGIKGDLRNLQTHLGAALSKNTTAEAK